MFTPLLHITLPEDDGEDRHFAPILLALEAMCAINKWHIQRALKRAEKGQGVPFPPLYASGVRYKEDPAGREDWRDCYVVLKRGWGDCLPLSTLVLRDDYTLAPLVALRPGDRIMGANAWTQVQENVVTGEKPILMFRLSNGCTLRCSPEHRLFRDVEGTIEEIRASDARIGDDLLTSQSIPRAATEDLGWPESLAKLSETDRAWLLGVFVADGWTEDYRAAISGRDGKPKEAQKRRVETLMKDVGVATRWHEKYIAINDRAVAEFFAKCGRLAPNKHLDSLRFGTDASVRAALDGLAADAGHTKTGDPESALVYTTTSQVLALQLRVLYRMLGHSVSIQRVDDHGGLGENPIYRLVPRLKTREGYAERREKKFARVRAIADGGVELCGDITTDAGRFWLPESDVLVHNCDNLVAWRVGELRAAGIDAQPAVKWQQVPKDMMIKMGHPADKIPESGISMVHCSVKYPDGRIEDVSKNLGMGGAYTNKL
jgi:hypothetical protein